MAELPVIVLAFANEQEGHRYLRDLPQELRQLQTILEAAEGKGLCKLVVRPNARGRGNGDDGETGTQLTGKRGRS